MNIIAPSYIYIDNNIVQNQAIAFDTTIKDIAPLKQLLLKFPTAKVIQLQTNSLVMPGLINAHVHLEFSANKDTLKYGHFLPWLYSVIKNRDALINSCDDVCVTKAIDTMLQSGTTSFGAVSSYGLDMQAIQNAHQNIVLFHEIIGSKAQMVDALFNDFKQRLDASRLLNKPNLYPAIAIHSPYSVHPVLLKKVIDIAKREKLPLSAHFLESKAEVDWLKQGSGDFQSFFNNLLQQNHPVTSISEFLSYFESIPTLMTHAVHATKQELIQLSNAGHTIIHCPISNRLLGNGALNINELHRHNVKWICATDGLSSNYTLNLFEEMKIALFMHHDADLLPLARKLLNSVTILAADALGLNSGEIKIGKNADMLVLDLPNPPSDQFALHLILHQYNISKVFINGQLV